MSFDARENEWHIGLTPLAVEDVNEILSWLEIESASAAIRLAENLDEVWDHLGRMPFLGRISHDSQLSQRGFRCLIIQEYQIFYKLENGENRIYQVRK